MCTYAPGETESAYSKLSAFICCATSRDASTTSPRRCASRWLTRSGYAWKMLPSCWRIAARNRWRAKRWSTCDRTTKFDRLESRWHTRWNISPRFCRTTPLTSLEPRQFLDPGGKDVSLAGHNGYTRTAQGSPSIGIPRLAGTAVVIRALDNYCGCDYHTWFARPRQIRGGHANHLRSLIIQQDHSTTTMKQSSTFLFPG